MRKSVERFGDLLLVAACMLVFSVAASRAQDAFYADAFSDSASHGFLPDLQAAPYANSYPIPNVAPLASGCHQGDPYGYDGGYIANNCPRPTPCLETSPGRSLYWHDICLGGYRGNEPLLHESQRARIYASLESLALFRDQHGDPRDIFDSGLREFDTEFEPSLRGTVGVALGDWYRLEGTWLQELEWSDRFSTTSGVELRTLDFRSRMSSGEINLRRRVKLRDWPQHYPDYWNSFEFSTLLGLRFLELEEDIQYTAQQPALANSATVNTTNKMSGLQIGGRGQWLYEDRGWLDFEFKGALLSNDLTVVSSPNSASVGESRTAFLIDASLICNYQVSSCITLRLGYNMVWLTGTALASRNAASSLTAEMLNADHDGQSIFHGPSIGLVFAR